MQLSKKTMLFIMLAFIIPAHASQPGGSAGSGASSTPPSAPSSSGASDLVASIAFPAALALGSWIGKDLYDWVKTQINGTQAAADAKSTQLSQVAAEIKIESDKISIAIEENKGLSNQYQNLVMLYNGGINTGLDKKEIQAEIKKIWEAMKANSTHSASVIQNAKERIRELEGKREAIQNNRPIPPSISKAQLAALPARRIEDVQKPTIAAPQTLAAVTATR